MNNTILRVRRVLVR